MSGITDEMARSPGTNVFVHGVTSIGNLAGVNLNDDESHRALLFAREHDIVVVPTPVDADFLSCVCSLGLEMPVSRIVVASDGVEPAASGSLAETLISNQAALDNIATMCGDAPITLSPFISTDVEWRLAASLETRLGRPVRVLGAAADLVRNANMKHVIRARASENGVPLTPAELVRTQQSATDAADLAAAIERTLGVTGRVVVKGSFGASGSSTFIVETESGISTCVAAITGRHDNDVYIVEPLFDIVCSPNIVMWMSSDGGDVSCVSVNDQCIDRRLVFAGSTYPSEGSLLPEMIEAASVLTRTLQQEGFTGAAGFDFCEYEDTLTGTRRFFLSELNARINGGMYATVLMERLNLAQATRGLPSVAALRSTSVFTSPTTFASVQARCGELMFNPLTGAGVVPFNPGRLAAGKIALACFGDSPGQVEELHSECRDRLG
ncbi:MAG: ATP-grasp domain-containing protein [Gemmatimonadaceae bacterium]|nr:ATP-grasp domain-containing protein [Gemmatimonadaceae bacterium]